MPKKSEEMEIGEMIGNLSQAINMLVGGIFNKESAGKHGEAISEFYGKLVGAGITPEHATELTEEYMRTMTNILKTTQPTDVEEFE